MDPAVSLGLLHQQLESLSWFFGQYAEVEAAVGMENEFLPWFVKLAPFFVNCGVVVGSFIFIYCYQIFINRHVGPWLLQDLWLMLRGPKGFWS